MKKLVTSAVLVAATMASVNVMAELSANAALTSNYMWRGATQSDEGVAVQGGVDWSNKDGLYAGTWASTVDFGPLSDTNAEIDFYAGKTFGDYDAGIIIYTVDDDLLGDGDVTELKLAGSFGVVSAELYVSLDNAADADYTYLSVSGEFDVSGVAVAPYVGSSGGDATGTHYGVSASKTISGLDLSATIDIADADLSGTGDDETVFFVSVSKSFEL